jgi:small-conductance mechanosensitive channel
MQSFLEFFFKPLVPLGSQGVSLWALTQVTVAVLALFYVSSRIRGWLLGGLLSRTSLDTGIRHAIGVITQYAVVFIGLLLILQTAGIDLTALSVVAGGLGIGIGFGLQNIANNLISGLIVLLERPVKIGDRIEVAGSEGQVVAIRARSTTVLTNDNIAIIIPNSRFITEEVINWSYNDARVRFRIPVHVSYGVEARRVERLLLEVARANADVLTDPAPAVRLVEFGDNGLKFELRAWSASLIQRKGKLISDLNFAILDSFREEGIEIPYPQREVRLRTGAPDMTAATPPPDTHPVHPSAGPT